ncbi:MAG: flagellin [Sulfuricurvum sp.]|nr:flagellin [Sulfuricurvum sp.]MDP3022325.1 flagellin [Sulfuricurvum sp.]
MQLNTQYQALPQMNEQSTKRDKTLDKIAAGLQLSMEDSASRSIASRMESQINTYAQELMNTNDSIGMTQIADGALSSLSESAQKLNDLSIRSNSASLNTLDQQALQAEFQRTQTSMQDIIATTSYNGKPLLDSSVSPKNLTLDNQDAILSYRDTLSSAQSDLAAIANNYTSQANSLLNQITQTSAAKSQIADTDMAKAINDFQNSNRILDASVLASAHQTQYLRESIGRLLG